MNWHEILDVTRVVGVILGFTLAYFLLRRRATKFLLRDTVEVDTERIVILPGPGVVEMVGKPTVDRLAQKTYDQLRDEPPGQACVWDNEEVAITTKYFLVDGIPTVEVLLGLPKVKEIADADGNR